MTFIKKPFGLHTHRWMIEYNTGDEWCKCGAKRGEKKAKGKKGSKLHNTSAEYNGIIYHSQLEARYAAELDMRIRAGDIVSWERQVRLDLKVNGVHICNYYIDFIAHKKDGSREFVEVKGFELPLWQMKWKILEATFDDFKKHPDDSLIVMKQASMMRFRRP